MRTSTEIPNRLYLADNSGGLWAARRTVFPGLLCSVRADPTSSRTRTPAVYRRRALSDYGARYNRPEDRRASYSLGP